LKTRDQEVFSYTNWETM